MKDLTPTQLGHRAAAQGFKTDPPAGLERDQQLWNIAFDRVEKHRQNGRDPNGHGAPPPHLCARNTGASEYVPFVCNCCASCAQECRAEVGMSTSVPGIDWPAVLGALPRIATVLEKIHRLLEEREEYEHNP